MTRMEQAQEALIDRQIAANGKLVLYSVTRDDGQVDTIEVSAWPGRQRQPRSPREPNVALQWTERDYFIRVTDLVVAGVKVKPVKGHRIVEEIDGEPVTFMVSPVPDEPAARMSDIARKLHRIHTKRVTT